VARPPTISSSSSKCAPESKTCATEISRESSTGSGPHPRIPGRGSALEKRKHRRRPQLRQRWHESCIAGKDSAAAPASPFSTLLVSEGAWAALVATLGATHDPFRAPYRIACSSSAKALERLPVSRRRARLVPHRWTALGCRPLLAAAEHVGRRGSTLGVPDFCPSRRQGPIGGRRETFSSGDTAETCEMSAPGTLRVRGPTQRAPRLVKCQGRILQCEAEALPPQALPLVVDSTVKEPQVLPFGVLLSAWLWKKVVSPR